MSATSTGTAALPYACLFTVDLAHAYWPQPNASLPWARFALTPETTDWVRRRDLLVIPHRHGVAFFCETRRRDVLLGGLKPGEAVATVKWYAKDDHFSRYTAPALTGGAAVYFLQSAASVRIDGALTQRLHAGETVDATNALPVIAPSLAPHLERADRLSPPVLVVQIDLADQVANTSVNKAGVDYIANFAARSTRWRYYYVCDAENDALAIVDLDEKVSFVATGSEPRSGGRRALVFESEQEIAMQQQYPQRFQLRERGRSGERVLIRRLPNAEVGSVIQQGMETKQRQEGQARQKAAMTPAVRVSEIYIN
ncbi:hypothetical protein [Pandoraea sp. PE-S2T-3]|uniref:hypothetical protein n=1 Tax=Pandoraea sp. PE-S2T-3 TaxID=1986993 RepID=UPI000B4050BA|nr:hypothetical protein [Pandoraea sp. PE-S2T-3]